MASPIAPEGPSTLVQPNMSLTIVIRPKPPLVWVVNTINGNDLRRIAAACPSDGVIGVHFGTHKHRDGLERAYRQLLRNLSGAVLLLGLHGGPEMSEFFRWYHKLPEKPLRELRLVLAGTPHDFTIRSYGEPTGASAQVMAVISSGQKIGQEQAGHKIQASYPRARMELLGDVSVSSLTQSTVLGMIRQFGQSV